MSSPGLVARGHLDVLRKSTNNTSQDGVDIVLIPGIGTASPESWPFADPAWLSTLPSPGIGARILAYRYTSPFAGHKPSWESLLILGYDFLDQLGDTQPKQATASAVSKPIIIVCHSLGGIIVKQALCVADKQLSRYESVLNAIAGVIFLSTPHCYADKATTNLARFRDVLDATTAKSLKVPSSNTEQDGAILLDLADRFERISLRTPILSVYELRESKNTSASILSRYRQLVTRETCSTHAPMETLIGLNLNHQNTCLFTQSLGVEGVVELESFIHKVLVDASQLIKIRLEDQEYQYATTSAYSPTMSEMPLKDHLQPSVYSSNQATEWPSNKGTAGTSLSGFEMVYSTTPMPEVRKVVNLPCHLLNIRAANDDFCGREDVLDRLAIELLPSKTTTTSSGTDLCQFALCGFGGIGKTEIAREFARRHKDSFDAVFWIMADEIAKLDHDYQQISLALGLEESSDCKSQVISREIVKGWLSNPRSQLSELDNLGQPGHGSSEATWLLIFDNADDPMVLADYWPQGSGSILITSRDPLAKSIFTRKISGLDLGPLTQQDSLSLFSQLTSISDEMEDDAVQQITDALGGVPLAISQMAGIIRRQDLTLSEFLELYTDHEEHSSLYETKFDTNLVPYRHSLSTVWAFEKLKPQARQLLELISFLDPDVIREELLVEAATEMLSEGATFRKSNYIDARADLLQASLVQRDKDKQHLIVHRIVQDVILATMKPDKKRLLFDGVVQVLWAGWPSAMPKPSREPLLPQPRSTGGRLHVGRWPACAAIYPHVLRIHQLWPAISEPSEATKLHFAKLLSEAAWYQKERGRTKMFDGFFDTALGICESSSHPDRDSVLADIHFCLGAIAMDASDFTASRIHKEKSLDLVSGICAGLGVADERLYLAYAERGISRIQDTRYDEGEADLKKALEIRKALGNYIPRSGEANLAWGLLAQGKLKECDTLLLESLAGREKALGKNDRESVRTGLILYVLGNLRAAQHQWEESYSYHERALKHMRETVGERDFYTANVAHKMAEHLLRMGRNEEAIDMTNKALDIWSVDPAAHKNEIARTTFLKSKIFLATNKTQKASIASRVACRLLKEITKEDKELKGLRMEDFDKIVSFWAR